MRRSVLALLAVTLMGLGLVGCGRFGEQRAAWRTQAEEACMAHGLVKPTAYMTRISEIEGPGVCGMTYPFKVAALAEGSVGLTNRVVLACPMIPQIDGWIRDTVQPAAELYFGSQVTEIRAGTYNCRGRNNQPGAKVSEHAFGNAMDVMGFKFADGRSLSVEKGWKGAAEEQDFLREVFLGACRHFTTVLAPGSDVFHYNHLHLDLARHDARGQRHICKPIIKFDPRLDPESGAVRRPFQPRPTIAPLPEPGEPLDVEDEGDPYAVSQASGGMTPRPMASAAPARNPAAQMPARAPAASPPAAYAGGVSSYAKGSSAPIPAGRPGADPYRSARAQQASPDEEDLPAAPALRPQVLSGSGLY